MSEETGISVNSELGLGEADARDGLPAQKITPDQNRRVRRAAPHPDSGTTRQANLKVITFLRHTLNPLKVRRSDVNSARQLSAEAPQRFHLAITAPKQTKDPVEKTGDVTMVSFAQARAVAEEMGYDWTRLGDVIACFVHARLLMSKQRHELHENAKSAKSERHHYHQSVTTVHEKERHLMIKAIGVWIDHRRAVIVTDIGDDGQTQQIDSKMEKRVRYSTQRPGGGTKPHQVSSENGRDRRLTNHLNDYYDKVAILLRDATDILILGPGEAKTELQSRLAQDSTLNASVVVQTADKLTDAQIVAEVRQHFQAPNTTPPQTTDH